MKPHSYPNDVLNVFICDLKVYLERSEKIKNKNENKRIIDLDEIRSVDFDLSLMIN